MMNLNYASPHIETVRYEEISAIAGSIVNGEPIVGPSSAGEDLVFTQDIFEL